MQVLQALLCNRIEHIAEFVDIPPHRYRYKILNGNLHSLGVVMSEQNGRRISLSLQRRWVSDILYFGRQVPTITGERGIRVKPIIEARRNTPQPPSWSSIMAKAMGLASLQIPELRQSYMKFPWPHLYEAPYSVATVVVDREFQGEHAVFCAPLLHPERLPLKSIQQKFDAWKTDPIEKHGPLRRLVRTSKVPLLLRRAMWWGGLNVNGLFRARTFGTFAINCLAGMRGRITQMCFPLTSYLYYGVPDRDGKMLIQYGFDHRVFDGYTCARIMVTLEEILQGPITQEVLALREQPQQYSQAA